MKNDLIKRSIRTRAGKPVTSFEYVLVNNSAYVPKVLLDRKAKWENQLTVAKEKEKNPKTRKVGRSKRREAEGQITGCNKIIKQYVDHYSSAGVAKSTHNKVVGTATWGDATKVDEVVESIVPVLPTGTPASHIDSSPVSKAQRREACEYLQSQGIIKKFADVGHLSNEDVVAKMDEILAN